MNRPLIAVSMHTQLVLQPGLRLGTHRTGINDEYVLALLDQGALPLLIPSLPTVTHLETVLQSVDGVLLTGGDDLPEPADDFPWGEQGRRHLTETVLIRFALKNKLPVFGICRGIQQINVVLGGSLIGDIPTERVQALAHKQTLPGNIPVHDLTIEPDSWLAMVMQRERISVNSFHHQAVDHIAANLRPVAFSPDGLVEAVEYTGAGWMAAVQYHPERMQDDPLQQKLIREFVNVCQG